MTMFLKLENMDSVRSARVTYHSIDASTKAARPEYPSFILKPGDSTTISIHRFRGCVIEEV